MTKARKTGYEIPISPSLNLTLSKEGHPQWVPVVAKYTRDGRLTIKYGGTAIADGPSCGIIVVVDGIIAAWRLPARQGFRTDAEGIALKPFKSGRWPKRRP